MILTILWILFCAALIVLLHIDARLFKKMMRRTDDMDPQSALAFLRSRDVYIAVAAPLGAVYITVRDWWRERRKGFRA